MIQIPVLSYLIVVSCWCCHFVLICYRRPNNNISHSMIAHACIMIYYLTRIPSTYHQNLSRIPTIPDRSQACHLIFFGKLIVRKMLFIKLVCSGRSLTDNINVLVCFGRWWTDDGINSPCLVPLDVSDSIHHV